MSISSVTSKVIYVGDAATATLAYPFKILAEGDLTVSRYVTLTSVASVLTLNTDYAVTGVGVDAGGNVLLTGSYAGGMPTGSNTIIRRVVDLTQTVDYVENDPFPANTHENALDKLCMSTQQLQEQIDRAVLADISQTSVSYVDFQTQAGIATSSATVSVAQASTATVQATNAAASAVQASSSAASASGAGVALDNLVTTAINQSLLPGSSNYIDIGSTTKVWNTANITTVASTLLTASTLRISGTANITTVVSNSLFQIHMGQFSRSVSTVSGTANITGVGFTAKAVHFIYGIDTQTTIGYGIDDGTFQKALLRRNDTDVTRRDVNYSIHAYISGSDTYEGDVQSFNSDGFVMNWSRTGTPTSHIIYVYYTAFG